MSFVPVKPELQHFLRVALRIDERHLLGENPNGRRVFVPIAGGEVSGDGINGTVLPGGGDWLLVRADKTALLDARYTLVLNSGEHIYVQDRGLRVAPDNVLASLEKGLVVDPQHYYFRTSATLETSATSLSWINHTVFIGSGFKSEQGVTVDFYQVK